MQEYEEEKSSKSFCVSESSESEKKQDTSFTSTLGGLKKSKMLTQKQINTQAAADLKQKVFGKFGRMVN